MGKIRHGPYALRGNLLYLSAFLSVSKEINGGWSTDTNYTITDIGILQMFRKTFLIQTLILAYISGKSS